MRIYLDSNIVCSNYYMTGPSFEVAQKVGTIVFGQIVVDEVCNKFKENLFDQIAKVKNEINNLNKLRPESPVPWKEINIANEYNKYKDYLERFIIENGMSVAEDYPEESHASVVHRALQRKKPFKSDGSTGYRDYLVWLTCLNVAQYYSNEEIHFISGNTRDFADPNDKERLHPDLLADLEKRSISETRFFYWNSLKSFIDRYAKQKLVIIEAQEALVSAIEKNEVGFLVPIIKYVNSRVIGCSMSGFDVEVPGDNKVLKSLDFEGEPKVDEIGELDNESLFLGITIDCIGVVSSTIKRADIKQIDAYDLFVFTIGRDEDVCTLESTIGMQIQLRAIYSKSRNAIVSIEIEDIDDYNCPYCQD